MKIIELKALEGKYLSSVESNIMNPVTEWLNPKLIFVNENKKVRVIAEIINKGSSLVYMAGKILNEKEQIVAKGSSRLFVLREEYDEPRLKRP